MPLHVPSIICVYLCSHSELSRLIKRIDTVNQNTDLKLILCSKHAVNLEIAMSKGLLELLSLQIASIQAFVHKKHGTLNLINIDFVVSKLPL